MTKNYLQGKLTAGSGITIDSANNISVTPATTSAIGGVIVGNGLEIDSSTHVVSVTSYHKITVENHAPSSSEGEEGDIWMEYTV